MKSFSSIKIDFDESKRELIEFDRLLRTKSELKESEDILPFFRKRHNLTSLIGSYCPDLTGYIDEIAYEFPIEGDFTSDLALRHKESRTLLFVEFEEGKKDSIFSVKDRFHPEWGRQLERGYSQIIDWLWKLNDMEKTSSFEQKIGRDFNYHGLLVIGRNKFLENDQLNRLNWRFNKTIVNSKLIKCVTYDQLYEMLENKLRYI